MERDKNMPNVNDLKDSKFLTKEDCEPDVLIVTIVGWDNVDVSLESGPPKMKYTLNFKEVDKPLVLNNTNGQRIAALTGKDEFDDWIGSKITLFNDRSVSFGGKLTGGIRVLMPQPTAPASPLPTTQQQAGYDKASGQATPDNIAARADEARAAYNAKNVITENTEHGPMDR